MYMKTFQCIGEKEWDADWNCEMEADESFDNLRVASTSTRIETCQIVGTDWESAVSL